LHVGFNLQGLFLIDRSFGLEAELVFSSKHIALVKDFTPHGKGPPFNEAVLLKSRQNKTQFKAL
jgi:hypothetical protein